jgi:hypothetical protein
MISPADSRIGGFTTTQRKNSRVLIMAAESHPRFFHRTDLPYPRFCPISYKLFILSRIDCILTLTNPTSSTSMFLVGARREGRM